MHKRLRLAVLLSVGGTTLQNLIDRIGDGRLTGEIVLVIANRSDAFGLTRAERAGIRTSVVERKGCASRDEFSARLFHLCREVDSDLVCLAGFLQLIQI